jgi:cytochrome P450
MHIGIQYIQYDERNYKNATEFYPERWTDTEDSGERNPYAFLPFSAGSRNCMFLASGPAGNVASNRSFFVVI